MTHKTYLSFAFFFFLLAGTEVKALFCAAQEEPLTDSARQEISTITREDVTVVASRLPAYRIPFADVPSNTSYIPANVTVKSEDQVHLTYPETFQESIQDAEGALFYDSVGNGVDTTFSLRGFQESSAVVVLLDGVRINELDGNGLVFPLISVSDLESIQIDRGSASHIYGNGAFGGVVHLTSGRPSSKPFSLFGGLEVSSFDGIRFYDGISGTLPDKITGVGGNWSYYFKGERDQEDGFRSNGEYRITNFDFKTAYELPDEQGRAYFGVKHVDNAISNPGELTLEQFMTGDASRTNKPLDGRKYRNTTLHMGLDKKFWEDKITASIFNSWRITEAHLITTSGTFTDFTTGSNPDTDFASVDTRQTDLVWQLGYQDYFGPVGNNTFLGMEFRDGSEFAKEQDAFGGIVMPDALVETERRAETYNTALFWREALDFYERVTVHAGMRHDFHWLENENRLANEDLERRWRKSTFSTGIILRPLKFTDIFANYSQGYRVPTISEIAPFSGTISQNLQPETSDSYEIGTRIRLKEKGLLKASWFLIDVEDEIVFDSTAVGPTAPFGQNANVGESRRTGIELRLDLKPIPEADLYGSYTYTEAVIRETGPGSSIVDGRFLGQVPRQRAAFGALFTPLKRYGEIYGGFRFGLTGSYTGKQHVQSFESTGQTLLNNLGGAGHVIKSYTLWNFLVSYVWREKEIYFKINNIFDNKYYSRAVDATSFGTAVYPAGDYVFVVPGAPREFIGGVRWEF